MSWGAVIVGGAALVSGYMSSQAQSSAAKKASNTQAGAANYATDTQYRMWQEAQANFAPYLASGRLGMSQLENQLPAYIQNTIVPLANAYGGFTPQALPNAGFSVNPVTGQMSQPTATGQAGYALAQQPASQPSGTGYDLSAQNATSRATQANNLMQTTYNSLVNAGSKAKMITNMDQFMTSAKISPEDKQMIQRSLASGDPGSVKQISASNGMNYVYTIPTTPTTGQYPSQQAQAQAQTTAPYSLASPASQADLEAGGVLSPAVPTLAQSMESVPVPDAPTLFRSLADFQFNTEDPVYQQKLAEKNRMIDTFLAKQGLQGSSAGESFRQNEINKMMAEEEQRQYDRALTERNYGTQTDIDQFGLGLTRSNTLYGRNVGERDYATQTAMDQYKLAASRGDTLYNRLYGQTTDLYNRQLQNTLLTNEQNQQTAATPYNLSKDIYNMMYGGAANLANLGSNAAGQTGQQSIATGQGMANTSIAGGNALAQGYLASGQAQAANWQNIGQVVGGLGNAYAYGQATQPTTTTIYPGYYSGGGSGGGGYDSYNNVNGLNMPAGIMSLNGGPGNMLR